MGADQQVDRRAKISRIAWAESLSISSMVIGGFNVLLYIVGFPDTKMALTTALSIFALGAAVLNIAGSQERRNR